MRKGKWSEQEKQYVRDNIEKLTPEVIAANLNRPIDKVLEIKDQLGIKISKAEVDADLDNSPEWRQLKDEMTKYEMDFFRHRYAKLLAQFSDDVLPTEESQIIQLLRFEILMNRTMIEINKARIQAENLQEKYDDYIRSVDENDEEGIKFISSLEQQIKAMRDSVAYRGKDLLGYQDKYANILEDLKATRNQRVDIAESRKKNFGDLIKAIQEKKWREMQGKELAMVHKGMAKAKKKLSEYHKYMDGSLDKPLLSAETVSEEGL